MHAVLLQRHASPYAACAPHEKGFHRAGLACHVEIDHHVNLQLITSEIACLGCGQCSDSTRATPSFLALCHSEWVTKAKGSNAKTNTEV